jgi:3-dehydroquinate synthase
MRQIAHGGDPFERGSVRPLDFGHWAAHKLEALSRYELRHGEAVAIGIALDTRYSVLSGLLPEGDDGRVRALLERLGFQLWHPACDARGGDGSLRLLAGLEEFREHLGGELTITLLGEIGVGIEVHSMDARLIVEALDWLRPRGS